MHANLVAVLLPLLLSVTGSFAAEGDCQGKDGQRGPSRYGHAWRHAQPVDGPAKDNVALPANDAVFDPTSANVQQNAVVTTTTVTTRQSAGLGRQRLPTQSAGLARTRVTTRTTSTATRPASTSTSTSSSTPPPAATPPSSNTGLDAFSTEILNAHNKARSLRGANPLVWDATLTNAAKTWAQKCVWKHGGNEGIAGGAGQNLAAGASSGATASQSGQTVVDMWVAEEKDYDPNNPVFGMNTGHFTQVVWKSSTKLGCFQQSCPAATFVGSDGKPVFPTMRSAVFTVCNYGPPGNYQGRFKDNVQKL